MPAKRRVSNIQFEMLLQWMANHLEQARGAKLNNAQAKQAMNALWEALASQLNAVGDGTTKSPKEWRVYWSDQKNKVRKKVAQSRHHGSGTGGGPPIKVILGPYEEQLLTIMGPENVTGNQNVAIDVNIAELTETPPTPVPQAMHSSLYVAPSPEPYACDVDALWSDEVPQPPPMSVTVEVEQDSREWTITSGPASQNIEASIPSGDEPVHASLVPSQDRPPKRKRASAPRTPSAALPSAAPRWLGELHSSQNHAERELQEEELAFRRERLEAEERWRREALDREERWRHEDIGREERWRQTEEQWRREARETERERHRELMEVLNSIKDALEKMS